MRSCNPRALLIGLAIMAVMLWCTVTADYSVRAVRQHTKVQVTKVQIQEDLTRNQGGCVNE